ncbi:NAD-dependent epimerase/dehydratase family protein [Sphingobacterium sp. BN32]|uniref:NAD-dependent epimerase/dehydratase family protein n=1 Tax=Sphingobacterium sp. BN32 TaxID=3058432 RepID=UPI00265D436A|nr:NAD-dependent epimerase/dehydratase family protein [Sphingobacterium sp. BN32]WKK58400.1 NAD-dependent epimerase/dehydratase family protein [Sphingobacterium sp. BN32]
MESLDNKVLIAGGSGFIGKNLIEFLGQMKYQVDTLSLRHLDWPKKMNENWSVIINLIGKAHDHAGEATEEDYYLVNFEYTKLLFTEFLNSKAKLFIHISSIAAVEEYGTKDKLVEGSTCHPISFYGKSKFAAEKWLLEQQLPYGKQLVILRPPMVHGKGDKGNLGLLYKFIAKGIPYPLTAYENQRSFISIQNFNFFIEQIIKNHTELKLNLYHISDDEALSTKEIIEVISKTLNKKPFNLKVPKIFVNTIAKIGDIIPIPLNSKRLKKMTGNLILINDKLKKDLRITKLPLTAKEGIEKTILTFSESYK